MKTVIISIKNQPIFGGGDGGGMRKDEYPVLKRGWISFSALA
jgi:hypothetical protein